MSKNTQEIPFTELVERGASLIRVSPDSWGRLRGVLQDVYLRELTTKWDWNFLFVSSAITTIQQYNTGTASINTDSNSVTFSSDAILTAAMTGRKIKFDGNDAVYDFTQSNTTAGTVIPNMQGPANLSSTAYRIFQPTYALAPDFDRFPKDGGVYRWEGGRKRLLPEQSFQEYVRDYMSTPALPENVRLVTQDTAGNQQLEMRPAPKDSRVYGYDYLKRLRPLIETTAGFIKGISANSTTVDGLTTARFNEATTGDWLRVDALGKGNDSQWYRILAIADNSSLTLSSAFANTAITSSANYTISRAPEIPVRLHPAVLYGAIRSIALDQNDKDNAVYYNAKLADVLSDGKRIYMSRVYAQEVDLVATEWQYRR